MNKPLYFPIFIVSVAALALEISFIRLFSISLWYHFAFMVVSIALFGMAAAGTFLSIKKIKNPVNISLILFSLSVLIGFFILNNVSFDPFKANVSFYEIFKLSFYYISLGLPFFFFGIIIAYSFFEFQAKSGKIYFFNLLGSAIGVVIIGPLFVFGAKIIIFIALLPLFSFLFYRKWLKYVIPLIVVIALLFFLPIDINLSPYKELNQALNYPNSKLLLTKYNAFSRVDLVESSFTRYAPGLSSAYNGKLPEQIGVLVDGSGMNAISKDGDFVNYLPSSVGYYLIERPKVLVINAGAGLDVLAGIKNNARVTALEINPIIVDLLQNEYKEFSNGIYNKADVYIEEGRSFVKKEEKYDLIIISLSGNVLASDFSNFNENYLLTKEAFEDYYNSLEENGYLIVTRWLDFPPREAPRLFSLALTLGEDNIAMFRSLQTVTLLLSKGKLDENEIDKIKEFVDKNRFDLIYLPSDFTPNKYAKFKEPYYYNLINNILTDKERTYNEYLFNIKPVSDDKPFYFNFFKWRKFPELYGIIGNNWQPFLDGGFLLLFLFFQALVLTLVFILLPLYFYKKIKIEKRALIYFFCIGLAFLFVEIFFIQKLILFLGHIIYSTTVSIFSLLVFSSIGALVSEKFRNIKKIILLLFLLIIIYYFVLLKLLNALIVLGLFPKIIISILLIMPIRRISSILVQIGIRMIKKELIPWAWAVNGAASVLSPILAILIALSFGYSFVLVLGGLIYFIGLRFIK